MIHRVGQVLLHHQGAAPDVDEAGLRILSRDLFLARNEVILHELGRSVEVMFGDPHGHRRIFEKILHPVRSFATAR